MKEYWERFKKLFQPKEIVKDIYEINFDRLKKQKIHALIVDIDDTLIPRTVNDIYPKVFEWVATRKEEGFKICLTSNSHHPLRVRYFGDTLGLPSMSLSFKPLPFAFWKSLEILNAKPENAAMIGDQLFMDILGANLLKIYSIYVKHGREETYFPRRIMRWAENWVISHWLTMP